MSKDSAAKQRAAEKRKRRELELRRKKSKVHKPAQEAAEPQKTLTIGDLPIAECVISEGWQERGLAHILLARRLPDGNLIVGGYYVDIFCLGIKDSAVLEKLTEEEYRKNIRPEIFNDPVEFIDCDPSLARAVAEGAAVFANKFGFHPNKRWDTARKMFMGIDSPDKEPVFGRDGKPHYIRRDETNWAAIVAKLERKAGRGNFTVENVEGAA